jgi:hypothetical protein
MKRSTFIGALGASVLGANAPAAFASPIGGSSRDEPRVQAKVIDDATGLVLWTADPALRVSGEGAAAEIEIPEFALSGLAKFSRDRDVLSPTVVAGRTGGSSLYASVNMDYDQRRVSGNPQIRVNRVWGNWTKKYSGMNVWAREVYYTSQGTHSSQKATRKPTTNSFNYRTGWGWVQEYPPETGAGSGARAFTSARYNIDGMGALTVQLTLTV